MNVAVVAHNHDRTEGTGGYTAELVAGAARTHDVTLYAARFGTAPPTGVRIVRVPALTGRAYGTILTFPAAYALRRGRHDIVHAQGWVTDTADVVTAHIVLAAWREALRASGQDATGGEKWLGGWVERREAALFRKAGVVIAPSEKARRDVEQYYGRTDGVVVIPHGFPVPRQLKDRDVARQELNLPPRAFLALYIGDHRKGLRNAIEALRQTRGAELLVVSRLAAQGPLDALAGQDARRIRWRPDIGDITRAYAAADVLLHPTIYDSFGLTVSESMAYGLPVIVSEHAGVAELIEHRRSGWIVRGDVAADAGSALHRLAGDPALREALAAGGREVASRHGWDETVRRTLEVYARVSGAR